MSSHTCVSTASRFGPAWRLLSAWGPLWSPARGWRRRKPTITTRRVAGHPICRRRTHPRGRRHPHGGHCRATGMTRPPNRAGFCRRLERIGFQCPYDCGHNTARQRLAAPHPQTLEAAESSIRIVGADGTQISRVEHFFVALTRLGHSCAQPRGGENACHGWPRGQTRGLAAGRVAGCRDPHRTESDIYATTASTHPAARAGSTQRQRGAENPDPR
jgi:hypothetical protein